MALKVRRVVTGHDRSGKAVVISDSTAPNVVRQDSFGVEVAHLWLTDATPADNADPTDKAVGDLPIQPPPKGSVFRVVAFLPGKNVPEPVGTGPGRHPFMHRTDTIDYQIVLSGEIDMLLDDDEVHLTAGDIVVQRGTNHAWVNRGTEPCLIAAVQIDAKPLG